MTGMLDAALGYAARGWPVFPCAPGTKVPAIPKDKGGNGVLDATTDPARITAWWTDDPGRNIGIATGHPGPDVIDVDVKNGSGYQAYADLTTAGLATSTSYVQTPSGGLHAYYQGTTQRNGTIRKRSLDFRAAGGYVLAPPSIVGGRPYTAAGILDPGGPADWAAIRALLDPPPDPPPFTQPHRDPALPAEGRPGDDWAARTTWDDILAPHGWHKVRDLGGGRACWRRPGKTGPWTSATTRENGGLYVFSTSTEFEPERPYSKFGTLAVLEHAGDHAAAARRLRADGYGTPLPAPAPVPQMAATAPAAPGPDDQAAEDDWWTEIAARHQLIDWRQLFDDTPEDEDWIVEPLIAAGRSIALYSPPKTGKSLLVLEIAAAVTTAQPVLGQPAGKRRRVLYVDLENSRRDLRDRLTDLGYKPADLEDLAYLSFPSLPALDSAQGGREILALALTHKAEMVIIDTVSRVISGGENDADTFAALYRYALAPLKGRGIAVIRIDHSGKDMSRGQRGSSAKNADVDAVWFLSGTGPHLTLRCEMTRSAIEAPSISLHRLKDPLRHEVTAPAPQIPDRVQVLMAKLDELGVPRTDGRMRCQKALNTAGVPVDTNALAAAVKTRRLQPDLSEWEHPEPAPQTGSPDRSDLSGASQTGSGKTAGQTCLEENQTGSDRSFRGEPGSTVWSGDPPLGGPAQTGADTGPPDTPQIHACPRCFAPVQSPGELCASCASGAAS